jgi:hypothetical protein
MNVDRAVLAFAGVIVLLSIILAWYFSLYWLALTAFVGLNLLQAAFKDSAQQPSHSRSWG